MDFKRKAIDLYKKGTSIEEINRVIGMQLEEEKVKKWYLRESIEEKMDALFELRGKDNVEERKKEINMGFKRDLEEFLNLAPDNIGMKIKLLYVNIRLENLEEARKIGEELLTKTQEEKVLKAMMIIEEKSGNDKQAILYIDKLLEIKPNDEYLKEKRKKLENKKQDNAKEETQERYKSKRDNTNFENKEMSEKELLYKRIATLESSIRDKIEKKQRILILKGEKFGRGEKADKEKITRDIYLETYKEIKEIAEEIISKYQNEIVARQRLVKALFIIGEKEVALQEAEELLTISDNNEIALWYMSKIYREEGDLYKEKEYLERIINNSIEGSQIKAQKRLTRVKQIIEIKEKEEELERLRQESYTEEARQEFIEELEEKFLMGEIRGKDLERILGEARKYPNYYKSYIEILNIKAYIEGDLSQKVEALETYISEERSTMTSDEYNYVVNEILETKEAAKIAEQINIMREDMYSEEFQRKKQEEEAQREKRYKGLKEQREFSQKIIKQLKNGEITKEDLPKIVRKLETSIDGTRAVFLIMKLYENLYSKEEAYKRLGKYVELKGFSPKLMDNIKSMRENLKKQLDEDDSGTQPKKEGEER